MLINELQLGGGISVTRIEGYSISRGRRIVPS